MGRWLVHFLFLLKNLSCYCLNNKRSLGGEKKEFNNTNVNSSTHPPTPLVCKCKLSKCSKAMSDSKSQEILSEGSLKPSLCDHAVSFLNFYLFIYYSLILKLLEASLKLNIQKTKITASGPVTSWQIDWETMETVTDFIFLGSKIIADGDCSHEIKRRLLLGRKAMTNLDSILKSRDIPLPTKGRLVKAKVFPVVMHGCESWTLKKAEHEELNNGVEEDS